MPLPASYLSRVCRSVADFVGAQIGASASSVRVLIGNPADAAREHETEHRVNLFFYLLDPSGFGPGVEPGETWWLRLHCLITAFAASEGTTGAGENDLRLIGEVVRTFHETPVLPELNLDGTRVRLQAVFVPLTLDQINHIWSTQGDVAYRPSVSYEMTLAPIIPRRRTIEPPRVGALGFEVRGEVEARDEPFGGTVRRPAVSRLPVDTRRDDWEPRICLVLGGVCHTSLSFQLGSDELLGFQPRVWIAGEVGHGVRLRWDVWEPVPATPGQAAGWRSIPGGVDVQAAVNALEPENAASAVTVAVPLPFRDRPAQLLLYAMHRGQRPDGVEVPVRSNPLLISLFAGGAG